MYNLDLLQFDRGVLLLNIVIKLILFSLQHRFIIAVYTLRHSLLLCSLPLSVFLTAETPALKRQNDAIGVAQFFQ